jgi:hypothetical protein
VHVMALAGESPVVKVFEVVSTLKRKGERFVGIARRACIDIAKLDRLQMEAKVVSQVLRRLRITDAISVPLDLIVVSDLNALHTYSLRDKVFKSSQLGEEDDYNTNFIIRMERSPYYNFKSHPFLIVQRVMNFSLLNIRTMEKIRLIEGYIYKPLIVTSPLKQWYITKYNSQLVLNDILSGTCSTYRLELKTV